MYKEKYLTNLANSVSHQSHPLYDHYLKKKKEISQSSEKKRNISIQCTSLFEQLKAAIRTQHSKEERKRLNNTQTKETYTEEKAD